MEGIDWVFLLLKVLTAVAVVVYSYYKWTYSYWKRRNVKYLPPTIPFGNLDNFLTTKQHTGYVVKDIYDKMKAEKTVDLGIYFMVTPAFMTTDLDLLKNVLIKDFEHFTHRPSFYNEKVDPLSAHLVSLNGTKWRKLRTKVTPTFTSGKLKTMFSILVECQDNLQKSMENEYNKHAPIDIKELLARFTTDIIGSCAFGLDIGAIKDDDSEFRKHGRDMFAPSMYRSFLRFLVRTSPSLVKALKIKITPKNIEKFFMGIVKDTIDYREKTNFTRNDFMQLLIKLKNSNNLDEKLTFEEIAAQCFIFFLAGFETSSTTMTFVLYLLSKHPEIQDKVREDINRVLAKYDGKMTYDALHEMTYLSQVIDESMRIYPPVSVLFRKCVKDYNTSINGRTVSIEKGTLVVVPILGVHHDSDYYPDPEKFDPERFSEKNKASRHPLMHIPFGEGPRICIGMRFGLLETKVGLISLLKKYKFSVSSKTIEPLRMQPNILILSAIGDVWLNAEKVEES